MNRRSWEMLVGIACVAFGTATFTNALVQPGPQLVISGLGGFLIGFGASAIAKVTGGES